DSAMRPNPLQRPGSAPAPRRCRSRLLLEWLESRIVPSNIDHSGGFASHGDLTANGSATFTSSLARLTDGGTNEAGSIFTKDKFDIGNFSTQFTFVQHGGTNPSGGGITFTIQNAGGTALGSSGGGLGYGPDTPGTKPGIPNSVAIKFDLFDNFGE